MKLAAWLSLSKIPDAEFAGRIRVTRQALWRYKAGERIPRAAILGRIEKATDGAVRPADFFAAPSDQASREAEHAA